jgi:hypothetical protein
MTKFRVGQVWADRKGTKWKVIGLFKYPVIATRLDDGVNKTRFTLDGKLNLTSETNYDLITLIKDTEGL